VIRIPAGNDIGELMCECKGTPVLNFRANKLPKGLTVPPPVSSPFNSSVGKRCILVGRPTGGSWRAYSMMVPAEFILNSFVDE